MYNSLTYKTKQFFWLILKIAIVFGCVYFIYSKLFKNESIVFSDFERILKENNVFSIKNIIFLLLFTFFNWFFEIIKWKTIVSFRFKIDEKLAIIQSLASLTTSLITPNRIGEYGAKALYFKKENRKQILGLNFLHNSFQLLITVLFGVFGISFLLFTDKISIDFSESYLLLIVGSFILVGIILLIKKINYLNIQFKKIITFFKQIPVKIKAKTLLYSVFRYVIFSHQYYYLLLIFNIEINYFDAIAAITAMYLIASIIPVLSLFDVVLKSAVAVFIFSFLEIDELKIISISLLMWIFNFVFPAIIGGYFVLTFKPYLKT